jgi:hypothetical protein
MRILNLKVTNESTKTIVRGKRKVSTHKRSISHVPCIRVYDGKIPVVLGDRVLRIAHKETPLIEYKPIMLIECTHSTII